MKRMKLVFVLMFVIFTGCAGQKGFLVRQGLEYDYFATVPSENTLPLFIRLPIIFKGKVNKIGYLGMENWPTDKEMADYDSKAERFFSGETKEENTARLSNYSCFKWERVSQDDWFFKKSKKDDWLKSHPQKREELKRVEKCIKFFEGIYAEVAAEKMQKSG